MLKKTFYNCFEIQFLFFFISFIFLLGRIDRLSALFRRLLHVDIIIQNQNSRNLYEIFGVE